MTLRLVAAVLAIFLFIRAEPASAQSPMGADPTAQSVNESQLLQELGKLRGRVTIPDQQAGMLQQPQGREYRAFREGALPWIGGVVVLGIVAAIAAFYFWRGRIRMAHDEHTGRLIKRFNAFERFTHWLTATSFIVLAITGLNYIFGKRILMPLLGPDAFAAWTQWAKYAHNFLAWPFILGIVLMAAAWLKDNLPDRYDAAWLKAGGGFFNRTEPVAGRFNAGQKGVFWSATLGGAIMAVTGILMLFPFWALDINGMQWAQYVHATLGVLLTAIMIAHIYIGTLGMEGAYEAMWSGDVDLTWARHHHRAWVDDQQNGAKTKVDPRRVRAPAAPAE